MSTDFHRVFLYETVDIIIGLINLCTHVHIRTACDEWYLYALPWTYFITQNVKLSYFLKTPVLITSLRLYAKYRPRKINRMMQTIMGLSANMNHCNWHRALLINQFNDGRLALWHRHEADDDGHIWSLEIHSISYSCDKNSYLPSYLPGEIHGIWRFVMDSFQPLRCKGNAAVNWPRARCMKGTKCMDPEWEGN